MKKLFVPIIVIFFAAACSRTDKKTGESKEEAKIEIAAENLKQVTFEVKGMTCEGCENAIKASINKLEGIQEATASYTLKSTVVSFDAEKTTVEDISQAITDAGYEVTGTEL
jgi:mercuric ion transport protein